MTQPRPSFTIALGFALGLALGAVLIREGMRSAPPAPSLFAADVAPDR